MRARFLAVCFVLALTSSDALAQFNGCLGGFCNTSGASGGNPAAYVGAGDVVGSAAGYWSIYRCYNTAYSGNVADVYAPADASHTLITCSSGGVVNETLQPLATTCASSCTAKTVYDQSGANNCSGSVPCDITNATAANRPTVTLNCEGTKPCMHSAGSAILQTAATLTVAQPYTVMTAARRTSGTSYGAILSNNTGSQGLFFGNTANHADLFVSSDHLFAQTDNTMQCIMGIANGASSSGVTDGSITAISAGSNSLVVAGRINTFDDSGDPLTGDELEIGLWAIAFSAGNVASMNSNVHSYWGF